MSHDRGHAHSRNSRANEEPLIKTERERVAEASKCNGQRDVLDTNFRDDIFVLARQRFESLQLPLSLLERWQKKYPLLYPWNTQYEVYRINVNRKFVVYPLMIMMCESERDVIKAMKIRAKYKLRLAARGGSHCMEAFSLTDGILIDQSRRKAIGMRGNEMSAEPGVLLGPMIKYLDERGYIIPCGSCPNVCLTGLSLGGGVGFLSRIFGATSDHMREARVLLANGKIITANEKEHSDLLWALKGAGGGNFGIVLGFKFVAQPIPKKVVFYELLFPFEQLIPVMTIWQDWAPFTHNCMGSELRFNNGKKTPGVSGCFIGGKEEATQLLSAFDCIPCVSRTIEKMSYTDCARKFAGKGRWLPFSKAKNGFATTKFPRAAMETVAHHMALGSGNSIFELNALRGKFNEPKPSDSAFVHRGNLFWMLLNCHWPTEDAGADELNWLHNFNDAMKPYLTGAVYQNMPDIELDNPLRAYYGQNLPRLIEIKRKYDPQNVFSFAQSIPVTP